MPSNEEHVIITTERHTPIESAFCDFAAKSNVVK